MVVFENLNIKGMLKNRCLSKAISQQGWFSFKSLCKQKMKMKGGYYVEIGRFYPSSKTCSCCGFVQPMPLKERTFVCGNCGVAIPRDFNAAININREGLKIIGMECPEYTPVEIPLSGNIDENQSCRYVSMKQEAQVALAVGRFTTC